MKRLTKQDIEKFAYEILDYLTKYDLDSDAAIYYNNKKIKHEYDWRNPDAPPQLVVKENMCPLDYFSYVNYDHILSMSFEGPLYEVLNYTFGKKEEGLRKIFEKYGVYWELGNAWNLSAYPIDDDMEIEFTAYKRPKKEIDLYHWNNKANPPVLQDIMDKWYDMSSLYGDHGSCVIGAGFSFDWNGDRYFMCSCSPFQGSLSWESSKDKIQSMLVDVGATDIEYHWGNMD